MTDLRASDFPELHRVFAGYLHEDFVAAYGTPEGALEAYWSDANEAERRRFNREAYHFLDATESVDFSDVQRLIERLGSRWIPSTRDALVAWLTPPIE